MIKEQRREIARKRKKRRNTLILLSISVCFIALIVVLVTQV